MFQLELDHETVTKVVGKMVKLKDRWERVDNDIRVNAEKYKEAIIAGILDQKYASSYPALSDDWVKRKGHSTFWLWKGKVLDTVSNVNLQRISTGGYMVSLKLPGYAAYNEARRPLFKPAFEETINEFSKFMKKLEKEMDSILR